MYVISKYKDDLGTALFQENNRRVLHLLFPKKQYAEIEVK